MTTQPSTVASPTWVLTAPGVSITITTSPAYAARLAAIGAAIEKETGRTSVAQVKQFAVQALMSLVSELETSEATAGGEL
jgi:hypothetical protein